MTLQSLNPPMKIFQRAMVRRDRHLIIKRHGYWWLYCPERGIGDWICTVSFPYILRAYQYGCSRRHWEPLGSRSIDA